MKRSPDRNASIRRRLLGLLVVPVALVLVAGTLADLYVADKPVHAAFDRALSDAALALSLNVQVNDQGHIDVHVSREILNVLKTDTLDNIYFQIASANGEVLAGDPDLPQVMVPDTGTRSLTTRFHGRPVRLVTYRSRIRNITVLTSVAETLNKRDQTIARVLTTALLTDLLVLVLVVACVWIGVRRALRPVDNIAAQLDSRTATDLAPLVAVDVPHELRGLIDRLNSLLHTIDQSSRAERRFLDDAAHQLRSPLSGVLAQLDLLLEDEADPAKRTHLLSTQEAATRLARTTQQLLVLAKSEHRAYTYGESSIVDLVSLAAPSISGFVQRASGAGIDLGADLHPAAVVGSSWLLAEALGNLIDNALTYTPRGGVVTVRTGEQDGAAYLEVEDSGAGIPLEERELVLTRFYRGAQSQGIGSGLGLAIVADVAQHHDAKVTIDSGEGRRGTRIRLEFPAVH